MNGSAGDICTPIITCVNSVRNPPFDLPSDCFHFVRGVE